MEEKQPRTMCAQAILRKKKEKKGEEKVGKKAATIKAPALIHLKKRLFLREEEGERKIRVKKAKKEEGRHNRIRRVEENHIWSSFPLTLSQ